MKKTFLPKLFAAAFALTVLLAASQEAFGAATIVILNNDAANAGFNDPTPAAPVGNNTGTTLGQQRLNAFQFAANVWGATLNSSVTITIRASWAPLECSANSAVLGSAGAVGITRFEGAPFAVDNTWYPAALANALRGSDSNTSQPEISARFNSDLGKAGCLEGSGFYLGLDGNHGPATDLVSVLLHEFAHGLGFQSFTDGSTGAQTTSSAGTPFPSIYDRFLLDNTTGKRWHEMTDAERKASAVNTGNLVWAGAQVVNTSQGVLGTPRLRVNAPAAVAGNYVVGTADFGPPLSAAGTTANVAPASPADACTPVTNPAALAGRIALVDRGGCNFVVKVKNAQNAGAVGVIVANNATGAPIQMGGGDATITIPSVMVTLSDGNALRSHLTAGLNATLLLDNSARGGVDAQGRPKMYTPATFDGGSSVSHWDTSLFPNQLMEPNISGDLIHSTAPTADLTTSHFRDIGWSLNNIGDVNFFVRQHYLDFLNREPDSGGLNFWREGVFACGVDKGCAEAKRINASAAFFLSIEFQGTGNLVYKMYKAGFGNVPGTPVAVRRADFLADSRQIQSTPAQVVVGQPNWEAQLEANKQAFALAFVQRPAFQAAHGGKLAAAYVDSLLANTGVTFTSQERQAALNAFGAGGVAGQAAALRSVADSASVTEKTKNESFVLMQYFGYLQRDPNTGRDSDYSGFNFWLGKLNEFQGNYIAAEMVKAFLDSAEYRNRFGS
ncbi:MAG TPA: PA domain-containing protein [Pyrinomonadaceae bacterium]|jgi:hypothetical protein